MRPHKRLDGFGDVSARHQRFSILFNHGKTQPTSSAIDHGFTAAAHKLQRVIGCLCLYFRPGRDDFRRQAVKLRDVVHAQVIMPVYLDDLPLGGSNRNRGCKGQASEDKRENRTTLYWEGHACAMVSKIAFTSSGDASSAAIFKFRRAVGMIVRRVVKVSIDLIIFRAKHRKCFCPFDVPPAV